MPTKHPLPYCSNFIGIYSVRIFFQKVRAGRESHTEQSYIKIYFFIAILIFKSIDSFHILNVSFIISAQSRLKLHQNFNSRPVVKVHVRGKATGPRPFSPTSGSYSLTFENVTGLLTFK